MRMMPQAMLSADIQRQMVTCSLRTQAEIRTANKMLDSRNAATSASGAWVKAHIAIP